MTRAAATRHVDRPRAVPGPGLARTARGRASVGSRRHRRDRPRPADRGRRPTARLGPRRGRGRLRPGHGHHRRQRRGLHRPSAASTSNVERTSILAIDTSASMAGARIAEAKKAALAYLASRARQRQGRRRHLRRHGEDSTWRPGLDREAATEAIDGLTLNLHTALYDGVLGAIEAAGPGGAEAGQREILVLSDGKDTTGTNLTDVVDAIKKSGAGRRRRLAPEGRRGQRAAPRHGRCRQGQDAHGRDPAA